LAFDTAIALCWVGVSVCVGSALAVGVSDGNAVNVAVAVLVSVGVIVREGVKVGTALAGSMGEPAGSVGEAVALWGIEQAASSKRIQDTGKRFFI
jgi:hypothetical protein